MATIKEIFTNKLTGLSVAVLASAAALTVPSAGLAQSLYQSPDQRGENPGSVAQIASGGPTYADLATLSDRSAVVVRAQIRRQTQVAPERAPGLAPGHARLYIEAQTLALIAGNSSLGESLVYLVDVPLNANGKPPKLKKREVLLFANVAGRGAKGAVQLQLTGMNAQLNYDPALEERLRPILSALAARDVPPVITGIGDALAVQGTLTGESETQIFLETADRSPVSLTVLRRPGQSPVWGVSWGEIIDSAASAPQRDTLRWYRLACALPPALPSNANLARDPAARRLAEGDYAFILSQLGPCTRAITQPSTT